MCMSVPECDLYIMYHVVCVDYSQYRKTNSTATSGEKREVKVPLYTPAPTRADKEDLFTPKQPPQMTVAVMYTKIELVIV